MKLIRFVSKIITLLLVFFLQLSVYSQAPQGFNYQAVIRNGSGTPIASQPIGLRITLENASHLAYYTETQTATSNAQGVISVTIGGGAQVGIKTFDSIPWMNGDVYIKLEIDPSGGTSYTPMGVPTPLKSVPYALYAENTKEVVSNPNAGADDPIFEVKNKLGQVVFGVYQGGVRIYIEESPIVKGAKSGFAVGGLINQAKGTQAEYMRITPDSARIYIDESTVKGAKGGFAVGGLINQAKGAASYDLLRISKDSARIYLDQTTKGAKSGFAVGGLINQAKVPNSKFLDLTPKNYFIGHESGRVNTSGEFNSFLGYQAGIANTSGSSNSLMGYQAGYSNTEGTGNLLLGYQSGYSNTTGDYNTFLGHLAGNKNTLGVENTFVGSFTGRNNTTGSNNTFLGFNTGNNNISGESNNFIGTNSGFSNTTGNHNVFIGTKSGYSNTTGSYNSFMGYHSGRSNTKGRFNVFQGYEAGFSNDSSYNTFIGYQSGRINTSGFHNVLLGYQSGSESLIGWQNVFIGSNAGRINNGGQNVFLGASAGQKSTTGSSVLIGTCAGYENDSRDNVFLGSFTGAFAHGMENTFLGGYSGLYAEGRTNVLLGFEAGKFIMGDYNVCIGRASGSRGWQQTSTPTIGNVFIGQNAAAYYETGNYNVCLGYESAGLMTGEKNVIIGGTAGQSAGSSNVMIGYNAGISETGNNKLYISNTNANPASALIYGEFDAKKLTFNADVGIGTTTPDQKFVVFNGTTTGRYTTTGWTHVSDIRLKENVTAISSVLSDVLMLKGVKFNFINDKDKAQQIGFIAQDFEKVFPEFVVTDNNGYKSIAYGQISAVLVEAVKEQQQQIQKLEEKVKEIENLKSELEAIKALLKK